MSRLRRKVLFFAEGVTLAHVARPLALARALPPEDYEIHFACDRRYARLLKGTGYQTRWIHSLSSEKFLRNLYTGAPIFDSATLRAQVQEDVGVIQDISPHLVVGDMRLSLSASTELTETVYVSLMSAHWSPFAREPFALAEHPLIRFTGVKLAQAIFRWVRPLGFLYHTRPLNRVRREVGLASLGWNLRRVYTDADYTLYPDLPELVPTYDLPEHHTYLGPILWSPPIGLPDWWSQLPQGRPLLYVNLGSSGRSELLETILSAVGEMNLTVILATAGRATLRRLPPRCFVADFLPGSDAAARATLVICNGGSGGTAQALSAGTPVLGIISNMDQYLNMNTVRRAGAGELLRADQATTESLRRAIGRLVTEPGYRSSARRLAESCRQYDAPARFRAFVDRLALPA